MKAVTRYVEAGRPVLGVCNGFQILCEAGLLPGALIRNAGLSFVCRWVNVRTEVRTEGWLGWEAGRVLQIPVKHGEGQWVGSPEDVARVEERGQVALRYCSPDGLEDEAFTPNGSTLAFTVQDGVPRAVDMMTSHPSWIDSAVMYAPTANGTSPGRRRAHPQMMLSRPNVATNSLTSCAISSGDSVR